jgi:hypothetical protein
MRDETATIEEVLAENARLQRELRAEKELADMRQRCNKHYAKENYRLVGENLRLNRAIEQFMKSRRASSRSERTSR